MQDCPIRQQVHTEETAADFNEIAQTIFFPIYPVIANQMLGRAGIDAGVCLDVGSGPGHLAIAIASLSNMTVFALDNAGPMCRIAGSNIARYNLEQRVKVTWGDVSAIPFSDASIDLVVSRGSFFFWDDLTQGFSECLRVLKPGCMACIGGGFGNARLRDEIAAKMCERNPEWETNRQKWSQNCSPPIVRSALSAAGISNYELVQDDSGYWVTLRKPVR